MNNTRILTTALAALIGWSAIAPATALALPPVATQAPVRLQLAQGGDCYAIGQRVAAEYGGQLAKAEPEDRGGQMVCVIIVLVPGGDGERPRRVERVEPM